MKNILFIDFNGVISYKPFWWSLEQKDPQIFEQINQFYFKDNIDLIKDWMKGARTSEEVCQKFCDETGYDYQLIYDTLKYDCRFIDIAHEVISKLRELKEYYHVILVTDNMDCFSRRTLDKNPNFDVFDDIFMSHIEWYFKKENNCQAFDRYISKYNAIVSNCILIDDSSNNCKAFEVYWWRIYNTKTKENVLDALEVVLENCKNNRVWQY